MPQREKRRRRKRSKKRIVGLLFEGDDESVMSAASSAYSIGAYDDSDGDDYYFEMTPATRRYRHAFIMMATVAIFLGLYFPTAVMKGIADGPQETGRSHVRKGKKSVDPSRRTKSANDGGDLSHALERKRKKAELPKQNSSAVDDNTESELTFDDFLNLQDVKKLLINVSSSEEQTNAVPLGRADVSQEAESSRWSETNPPLVSSTWKNMNHQQQSVQTEQHKRDRPVVSPIDNRFISHMSAEQNQLELQQPIDMQPPIPQLNTNSQADRGSQFTSATTGGRFGEVDQPSWMADNDMIYAKIWSEPFVHSYKLNGQPAAYAGEQLQQSSQQSSSGYLAKAPVPKQTVPPWTSLAIPFTQMTSGGYKSMRRRLTGDTGELWQHSVPLSLKLQSQQDINAPTSPMNNQGSGVLSQQQGNSYGESQRILEAIPNGYEQNRRKVQGYPQQPTQQQTLGYPQQEIQQPMQGYVPQQAQAWPQQNQQPGQVYSQQQNLQPVQGYQQPKQNALTTTNQPQPQTQGQPGQQQEYQQQTQMASNTVVQQQESIPNNSQPSQGVPMTNANQQTQQTQPLFQQQDQQTFQQQTLQSKHHQKVNQSSQGGISSSSGIPSHVLICQIILGEQEGSFMEEHESCLDEVNPSQALAHIFLSAYLAHQARAHGYRVEYEHNCGGHRNDRRLIQELLPSPFHFPEEENVALGNEELHSFCQLIIDAAQEKHQSNALDILLWDTNTSAGRRALTEANMVDRSLQETPVSMLERIAPLVLSNLYQAAMQSRMVKTALKAGYGVLKGRDVTSEHIATGRAVIYLPCRDHKCEDLALVPYMNYLMHLPISVSTVDVVVPPHCMENLPGCSRYVNDLASMVRQFAPDRGVEVIQAAPSSPDTFARLLEAEYVLCAPGFGMGCLFPALGRTEGRVTLFDVGPNQVEGASTSSYVARLPADSIKNVTPPLSTFGVAFLSNFMGQDAAMIAFVQKAPIKDTGDCRFFRGRVGQWTQDMVYAQHAQYRTPLSHYSGNADKVFKRKVAKGEYGDMEFRPPTTYRWDEVRYQACPVTQVTQEGVCEMLKSLNAKRIFILGDSLNLQLAQSMWMWLTNKNFGKSPNKPGKLNPNFKTTIQCMGYGSYILQYVRNDEFLENDDPVSIDEEEKNCATYCYPWIDDYIADESRTILIANVGAHLHEFEQYKAAIDRFVDAVDSFERPNDIVLYRTLVQGHSDCSRPGLRPFKNFNDYLQDAKDHPNSDEDVYTWDKFKSYNDYAATKLDNRRFLPTSDGPRALMELLDVNPMTILRPDGHCSDEFRPRSYLNSDCLHYTLPGPVDWWSHMAFSHLQDIATAENFMAQHF